MFFLAAARAARSDVDNAPCTYSSSSDLEQRKRNRSRTYLAQIRLKTNVSGVRYKRIHGYLRILVDTYPIHIDQFFI
jgi:hypothetical protein